ncbi:hypothetical protein ACTXT7_003237 [Hymenolepis weldensis]
MDVWKLVKTTPAEAEAQDVISLQSEVLKLYNLASTFHDQYLYPPSNLYSGRAKSKHMKLATIQYHMERDAASCEALHDSSLHTLSGSKISLPRANSLPPSLKPVNSDGVEVRVIKVNEDGVPATALWHCRPSVGSAPALCSSRNSNTTHNHKPPTDILNRSDIVLHSSSSSSSF